MNLPAGYYLKSAKYGAADVLRAGLDLSGGVSGRLELEIAGDGGRVEGVVIGEQDLPVRGARVTLAARSGEQRSAWVASTDGKGNFTFTGIPPGEYRVRASEDPGAGERDDSGRAEAVSVQEHGAVRLRLKAERRP